MAPQIVFSQLISPTSFQLYVNGILCRLPLNQLFLDTYCKCKHLKPSTVCVRVADGLCTTLQLPVFMHVF